MGLSIGLVGLGSFGRCFADLFKHHPLVSRIALCDREPDRIKPYLEKPSFRDKLDPADVFTSLDDICKSDVDALVIITQHWLHAPQAIQALEAGKHVYSAVPLITIPDGDETLEWCGRLVDTVRRTGLRYMYGETTYYRPQAMFCRRRAAEGAFGDFTYSEGEYFHDRDHGLREVRKNRLGSAAGQEWVAALTKRYGKFVEGPPMHYPTHSTAGPMCVMKAHAVKVAAWPFYNRTGDPHFIGEPSNETALFKMSNGATMRICEHREIGHRGREIFRIYGTEGCFENDTWCDKKGATPLTIEQMRDPLPPEVADAFSAGLGVSDVYGGHGGSHAWLVHEFVDALAHDRMPVINAWEAARYTAAGVMAHKSAMRDGEVLDVPDWGDAPV